MHQRFIHICFALSFILVPWRVEADGSPTPGTRAKSGAEKVGADAAVADPRIPPVFPGEEVRDGDKVMKMWSTSGPVPVAQPPEPWPARSGAAVVGNGSGVGVIVDARRD
ncbi:MAG: hypothetical protein EBZ48_16075, partial [Proteobacteria bacterium]|nr:hypothetical protein [Pseudomonadota bacterium]